MTPAAFLQCFPEFEGVSPTLIGAKLAMAATRMGMAGDGVNVWGPFAPQTNTPSLASMALADVAQGNLAAHYLIASPMGASTLLVANKAGKSSSFYLEAFGELEQGVAGGFAVAGVVT